MSTQVWENLSISYPSIDKIYDNWALVDSERGVLCTASQFTDRDWAILVTYHRPRLPGFYFQGTAEEARDFALHIVNFWDGKRCT